MAKESFAKLDKSWRDAVGEEIGRPYMQKLLDFLDQEMKSGQVVYPRTDDIFYALDMTPLDKVSVVILGQDPYHGAGQAHGLAFSVARGVKLPPSLKNIYKEIESEFAVKMPASGDLSGWARQGVLLLNTTLTVREAMAGSHQKRGWEDFTDTIIRTISDRRPHAVFMLWGSHAQKKGIFIDKKKHLVLEAPHPSPLSAHRGFLGCGHFMKANEYLRQHGLEPINWQNI